MIIACKKGDRLTNADEAFWRTSDAGLTGLNVIFVSAKQLHRVG